MIRTIHHLAHTGGTIITRCLAAMDNVVLLNEISPRYNPVLPELFSPCDSLNGLLDAGLVSDDELSSIVRERIEFAIDVCERNGKVLLIRDHSHADFFLPSSTDMKSSLLACLDGLDVLSVVTVRHPLRAYQSFIANQPQFPITLDSYCERYLQFASVFQECDWAQYERFCLGPEAVLQHICSCLDIDYTAGWKTKYLDIRIGGGSMGDMIAMRPPRECPQSLDEQCRNSSVYGKLCSILGYS